MSLWTRKSYAITAAPTFYPCTLAVAVTAGDLIVVIAHCSSGSAKTLTVFDDVPNTYRAASDQQNTWGSSYEGKRIYGARATTTGTINVSCQTVENGDGPSRVLEVWVWQGQGTTFIDNAIGLISGNTYTGTLNTSVDDCLIIASAVSSAGTNISAGSGFTAEANFHGIQFDGCVSEYKAPTLGTLPAGPQTVAFSNEGSEWFVAAAFRPSGSGGGGISPTGGGVSPGVAAARGLSLDGASWIKVGSH